MVKIGVISDIHSNIDALENVMNYFKENNVDKIICVGDVIGIGPFPEKCIDFFIKNEKLIVSFVRGNHENYLLNGLPKNNHNDKNAKPLTEEQLATHYWNHSRLNKKEKEFIKKLKNRDVISFEGIKIVVEHYPMDNEDNFKKYEKQPNKENIENLFENKDADIYIFGHTHERYYLKKNNKYFINPGSLGCPINTNGASAGILEINGGEISYKQLNIKYNVDKVINVIKKINYPLNNFMITHFFR